MHINVNSMKASIWTLLVFSMYLQPVNMLPTPDKIVPMVMFSIWFHALITLHAKDEDIVHVRR